MSADGLRRAARLQSGRELKAIRGLRPLLMLALGLSVAAMPARAVEDLRQMIDNRDLYERALSLGLGPDAAIEDHLNLLLGDTFLYDDNVFRIPSDVSIAERVGPNASREDHINTETAEFDGQRTYGRQVFSLDAQAAYNRYAQNSDLDNFSTRDRLTWAWQLGDLFSGELGGSYNRQLASFVNSTVYTRNVYSTTSVFGTGRYQFGPHWAVFAGVFNTDTTLNAAQSAANDNTNHTVDIGTEYAFDPNDSVGFEYRYTDTSFSHSIDPDLTDYREDIARVLFKYQFSEKTLLDASGGYTKRSYTISNNRDFSGEIGRITFLWVATEKIRLLVNGFRRLSAYETAATAYFVTTGVSLDPTWLVTDKIVLTLDGTWDTEKYIGSSDPTLIVAVQGRHDNVNSEHVNAAWNPIPAVTLTATAGFEHRDSNYSTYSYRDRTLAVSAVYKF